jgi:hypothetical protein
MARHDSSSSIVEEIDLKSLDRQFKSLPKQLEKAACNIDQVLKLAAEQRAVSIKDVIPLSSTKEGMAAVDSLSMIRTKFITRIIVFREMLLPVSSRVVNALHNLLDFMDDEELFLELAKAGEVSELCNFHAKDAADVQKGYEYLSADLLALTGVIDKEFKKVRDSSGFVCLLRTSLLHCCDSSPTAGAAGPQCTCSQSTPTLRVAGPQCTCR